MSRLLTTLVSLSPYSHASKFFLFLAMIWANGACRHQYGGRCGFMDDESKVLNCVFKSKTKLMGDDYLPFQILEKLVLDQLLWKPALDNSCALLRMLVSLDSRPTRFSQQSIISLSNFLPGYLIEIEIVACFPDYDDETPAPVCRSTSHYYLLPCYFLFYRSGKLLNLVLNKMGSLVTEKMLSHFYRATDCSGRINAIVSAVLLMHEDVKIRKILSSCKAEIDLILQNLILVQSSEEINMVIEERHKMHTAVDRQKTVASTSFHER